MVPWKATHKRQQHLRMCRRLTRRYWTLLVSMPLKWTVSFLEPGATCWKRHRALSTGTAEANEGRSLRQADWEHLRRRSSRKQRSLPSTIQAKLQLQTGGTTSTATRLKRPRVEQEFEAGL
ncbi:hypothetical protein NDU88_007871 [Pleurodeles waltl]|uniref:Uncharacterized protein n=1 Tax=Pleurodeles waltl TaxID=8319 RepID=A0AAV7PMN1_PLEWA|nr:hypothetical protein NDU88_007871 [Pleurodeles waltl]